MTTLSSDANALARLIFEMERPPFHQFLQPQAERIDETGAVTITLPFRPEFRRAVDSPGYHGGVIASLIDIAGHAAVAVNLGRMAPTVDLRIDYLRVAQDENLTATSFVRRLGRTLALVDVEIKDQSSRLIAVGRGTFSTAHPQSSQK